MDSQDNKKWLVGQDNGSSAYVNIMKDFRKIVLAIVFKNISKVCKLNVSTKYQ